jgi:MFS family permease
MVGRNGVFYDREGRDWDATITRIVEHPISVRQAFWSPYKKLARMAAEQFQKFAAAKAKASDELIAKGLTGAQQAGAASAAGKAPAPFDVARFAGIFAAIGLAIGAIGTALASILTGFLGLKWWQMPLALAGLVLIVSGPAVVMAWIKLRNRNLGPLLDANGWAVNARARINVSFGTSLTQLARLPEGAERTNDDPYADKRTSWKLYFALLALSIALLVWVTKRGLS